MAAGNLAVDPVMQLAKIDVWALSGSHGVCVCLRLS